MDEKRTASEGRMDVGFEQAVMRQKEMQMPVWLVEDIVSHVRVLRLAEDS